jgi:hypothetical protein
MTQPRHPAPVPEPKTREPSSARTLARSPSQSRSRHLLRILGRAALTVVLLLSALWAVFALWYRLPLAPPWTLLAGALWVSFTLAAAALLWRGQAPRALVAYGVAFAMLLGWWTRIEPSDDRQWADDVARHLGGRVDGSVVTLENVRNFDWRSDTDYTARWETRRYDLDRLRSVDMALSYWMGPAIAHTLVSFGFDDGRGGTDHAVFSIEIRKERGEQFSAIAGFFKQFELSLVAADERDVLRVRTNVRGEDVYLYRVAMAPPAMRSLFLAYVDEAGALARTPRFYDTLTANCTTIVFEMVRRIVAGLPVDYRLLASGYLPEYLYDIGALAPGRDLEALRAAGRITERARQGDADARFSSAIRRGIPGIAEDTPP